MTAPRVIVETVVEAQGWAALGDADALAQRAADAAFAVAPPPAGAWTACVLLTGDAEVAGLNARFRDEDKPTDVLSWPAFAAAPGPDGHPPPIAPDAAAIYGPPRHLGDIALAFETVSAQASSMALALGPHAIHLIVHACLHLLGYDHADDAGLRVMRERERRAMADLGLHDPYG